MEGGLGRFALVTSLGMETVVCVAVAIMVPFVAVEMLGTFMAVV